MASQQLTFSIAANYLPRELLDQVLRDWLGPQCIFVDTSACSSHTLRYASPNSTNLDLQIGNFDIALIRESSRFRVLSWLRDRKDFQDPYDFYMSHLILSTHPETPIGQYLAYSHPWLSLNHQTDVKLRMEFPVIRDTTAQHAVHLPHMPALHGLEKIKLDFTAEQLFALFGVTVAPFNYQDDIRGDSLYHDAYLHAAGHFLAHTKDLELHFGDAYKLANPWYDVQDPAWCKNKDRWPYGEARLRPHVCESGAVIDRILEYGWYNGYLQPVQKITLTGNVQEWVKKKWSSIFDRHAKLAQARPKEQIDIFAVHTPDIKAIETIGMAGDKTTGDGEWEPRDCYPPPCQCKIACSRLKGEKPEDQVVSRSWDDLGQKFSEVVGGDWMSGIELGPVC
ncbi:hypothetical protein DDE83_000022 [Stemphylium lycopersici]|uniref:Uncharacterized protein n=1 Tax=Stemphylium lycopersici TaxID=183478 RepID=A0A364NGT2_STELY|nr:hypothetical protein DDE83_000022 [Stemphylium lycopersici]